MEEMETEEVGAGQGGQQWERMVVKERRKWGPEQGATDFSKKTVYDVHISALYKRKSVL